MSEKFQVIGTKQDIGTSQGFFYKGVPPSPGSYIVTAHSGRVNLIHLLI